MQPNGGVPFSSGVAIPIVDGGTSDNRAGCIADRRFAVGAVRVAFSYGASRCGYSSDGILLVAMVVCRGRGSCGCNFAMQCIRGTEE
jgi:hypothetical protein